MPDPSPRSEKALIAAAADWCRSVRAHFEWSSEDFARECSHAARWLRFANGVPTAAEIEMLEAGRVTLLPRWLRSAERAELDPVARDHWPRPRTWFTHDYTGGDPFDCSYPLLFRDEYYFLEDLNQMPEDDRRALRRFTTGWNSLHKIKKDVVERLLADLNVRFESEIEDEFEANLVTNAKTLDPIGRQMLLAMATDPKALSTIFDYIERTRSIGGELAELMDLVSRMGTQARATVLDVARLAAPNEELD
jgi:hypothetical protein